MEAADVARPPDPADAGSWEAFTESLRELHLACGRPTYEALSARSGLPKSAISYLIGRNPVRQPSRSTVLRFVEGCLGYAGRTPEETVRETNRWRQAHERLSSAGSDEAPAAPPTSVPPPANVHPGPARRRRTPLVATVGVCLALLVGGVAFGVARAQAGAGAGPPVAGAMPSGSGSEAGSTSPATPPTTSPSPSETDVAAAPQSGARCVERADPQNDARLGRDWPTVFYCPNRPAKVYTWARDDGRPIADLQSRTSWFVCWTDGLSRAGAPEVFYYTQGDTTRRRPELDSWGYVPASAVKDTAAPAAGLTRRCPFPTAPTSG